MMDAEIVGLDMLVMKFTGVDDRVKPAFADTMAEQIELLEDKVKERMGSLFHNPGRMQESLSTEIDTGAGSITGTVMASGLPYLAIQEFGGQTKPHPIDPVHATVLAFMAPGKLGFSGTSESGMVFAKHVNHPGSKIPERSYARFALHLQRNQIVAAFQQAAESAMSNKALAGA